MKEEKKKSRQFSRNLYVVKDTKKEERRIEKNIRSVRSGYGMHPKYLRNVLEKVNDMDYAFGDRFE
jgi:pseudaminic acid synthase